MVHLLLDEVQEAKNLDYVQLEVRITCICEKKNVIT